MTETLLPIFQKAYKDLDLFPLIEPEQIESFRVDYGREVMVRLKQEVNASVKDQKFVFAGHRGCGKSTLLKRFAVEMQPQHFVVFFSIADLLEPAAVTHRNILYAIALKLLSAATQQQKTRCPNPLPPMLQNSRLQTSAICGDWCCRCGQVCTN